MVDNVISSNSKKPTPLSLPDWSSFQEPFPYNDGGVPFEHIPDLPGVIALLSRDGIAIKTEACSRSMRRRVSEYYTGLEPVPYGRIVAVAFEQHWNPAERQLEVDKEHEAIFGFRPAASQG
jgi:hypothetical protein